MESGMTEKGIMRRHVGMEFLFEIFTSIYLVGVVIFCWDRPTLASLLLAAGLCMQLWFWREKADAVAMAAAALLGTPSEMICVKFGVWTYNAPGLFFDVYDIGFEREQAREGREVDVPVVVRTAQRAHACHGAPRDALALEGVRLQPVLPLQGGDDPDAVAAAGCNKLPLLPVYSRNVAVGNEKEFPCRAGSHRTFCFFAQPTTLRSPCCRETLGSHPSTRFMRDIRDT